MPRSRLRKGPPDRDDCVLSVFTGFVAGLVGGPWAVISRIISRVTIITTHS